MRSKKYDIIVIGGGHNGLVAASILAKEGRRVVLYEKEKSLGGLTRSTEFHPGFYSPGLLQDTSTFSNKVIKALHLEKHGLLVENSTTAYTILGPDGEKLQISDSHEETVERIGLYSKKDAEAYQRYRIFLDKIRPFVNDLTDNKPPDLQKIAWPQLLVLAKKGWKLKRLGNETMLELLKVAPMCVADFLNEYFETNFIKAGLAAPAIYGSFTGPWSPYTTLNLLLHECSSRLNINGGPQAILESLISAANSMDVVIEKSTEVKKIVLGEERNVVGVQLNNGDQIMAPVVLSACNPKSTFLDMLEPSVVGYKLEHAFMNYRSRGTTAKINLALNKHLEPGSYRTGLSLDDMEKAYDSAKYRQMSDHPVLDIMIDANNAPESHSVLSVLVHFAPYDLEGGWNDSQKEKLLDNTLAELDKYFTGIRESVLASQVISPFDLEQKYSLPGGQIFHGEHAVDQILTRPIPECANYETPIKGLYLGGSGSHPGGGISGLPGLLSAERVLSK